ncbi:MAG: hypothetical protein GXX99_00090 [Clostridiales bacterium]|nr:hypothetical protein [Clostridiales bacterium]
MRHRSVWIVVLLLLLTAAGCTGKTSGKPAGDGQASSGQSVPNLPDALKSKGWQADKLPDELPEYTEGVVANSGGEEDDYTIILSDTDKEALARYLDQLREGGWIVTGENNDAKAVLGLYTLNFKWNDPDSTWLQINLRTGKEGAWPADQIPPEVLQPPGGTLVGGVEILQSIEDMWYFTYTYDGIDEEAARAYMQLLRDNGWIGDDMAVSKAFEWRGEEYGAYIEVYETIEIRTTFSCNFYLGD